jgi:hypothetical protein
MTDTPAQKPDQSTPQTPARKSKHPNWNSQRSPKNKSAAQKASEANHLQQRAILTNSPRPGDRQAHPEMRAPAPKAHTGD